MAPNQKTNAFCPACVACPAVARGSKIRLRPLGYGATAFARWRARRLVGLGRLELPTSRLSSARSNQLSYKPLTRGTRSARTRAPALSQTHRTSAALARVRPRRKRNEDGEIPPMQLNGPVDHWPLMFLKRSDSCPKTEVLSRLKDHP